MTTSFGTLLMIYRQRSIDPDPRLPKNNLTRHRFAKRLVIFTGATHTTSQIRAWENGKAHIHQDNRKLLVSIVRVLYECGGICSRHEADWLLAAGNYRALNWTECRCIDPNWCSYHKLEKAFLA